jgi:lysophospholipase L1-like esterase
MVRRMRTILCYGDSNTWGCVPFATDDPPRRFAPDVRWPGVLRRELGPAYWVVEEGLNGRTTVRDDELEPFRNGHDLLLAALQSHQPIDLVIVMLGTNDLKQRFGVGPREIAEGAGTLVELARASACGPEQGAPEVLLVCPAPILEVDPDDDEFAGGAAKSQELAAEYARVAESRRCAFLDAGAHVSSSELDGVHLDEDSHARLGAAFAAQVRALFRPNA